MTTRAKSVEELDTGFRHHNELAHRCFADATDLLKEGKKVEAKKLERQGDEALKRAKAAFKEIKAAAKTAPAGRR